MTPFAKRCELEALITEREGMLAENQHRLHCGNSIAYAYDVFAAHADRMRALAAAPADDQQLPEWCKKLIGLAYEEAYVLDDRNRAALRNAFRCLKPEQLLACGIQP